MSEDSPTVSTATIGRPELLAETFVGLADSLVADYDVVDLLERLAAACVNVLGATAAGLLLTDQRGNLAVVASSSEESRLLEIFQLQADEGPCLDCVRAGAPVTSANLGDDRSRWPKFVPEALSAGYRSVVAVPLRLREETIGGLNLFHAESRPLTESDQRVAQALAAVATIGILQQRSAHRSAMLAEQLQLALNSRVVIEQAKGVVAERNRVTMQEAFGLLRKYSRDHNRKLGDVALATVLGDLDPAGSTAGGLGPQG